MSGGKAARIRALRAAARHADDADDALRNFASICREMADAQEEERDPEVMAELLACAQGRKQSLEEATKMMLAFLLVRAEDMGMPQHRPLRRRN